MAADVTCFQESYDLERVYPGTLIQNSDQQCLRSKVLGSETSSKYSPFDKSCLRVIEESLDKLFPVVNTKENLVDVSSCQQPYATLKDLSSTVDVDASGLNNTSSSVVHSGTTNDKPIDNIKKKKKKKKKGSKNLKCFGNVDKPIDNVEIGSIEFDHNFRTPSLQFFNLDDRLLCCQKKSQSYHPVHKTSVYACEATGCLRNATTHDGKLISGCLCCKPFLTQNFVHSACRSNAGESVICGRDSKEVISGGEELKTSENKISLHSSDECITDLKENHSPKDLPQYMSCGTESNISSNSDGSNGGVADKAQLMSSNSDGSNGGIADKAQLSSTNTMVRSTYEANLGRRKNISVSESDVIDKTKCRSDCQSGNGNNHLAWQKNKKHYRDVRNVGVKISNHLHAPKDANSPEKTSSVRYDSFSSNALLPTPIVSSAGHHDCAHQPTNNKQGMYSKPQVNEFVKSSQWIAQHRCSSGPSHVDSEWRQAEAEGNKDLGKLKQKGNFLCKYENMSASKKRVWDSKANFSRFRNKMGLSEREVFEIPGQLHHYNNRDFTQRINNHNYRIWHNKSYSSHLCPTADLNLNLPHMTVSDKLDGTLFTGFQLYPSMKILRTERVSAESLHASLDKGQRSPFCIDFKNCYGDNIRKDFNSRVSSQKWIPVGRKDSEVQEKSEAVYDCKSVKDVPDSCSGKEDLHIENLNPSSNDPDKTCLMSTHDKPKLKDTITETLESYPLCENIEHNYKMEHVRDDGPPCNLNNGTPLHIGSQMARRALNAALRLRLVSENIQLATGGPLAEFEKLLQLASPVLAVSSASQQIDVCLKNRLQFSSHCKHQLVNIPLRDLWGWYEKPGNYGLEVRAENSMNIKGMDTDSVSFNAHFVPLLSAIQLFGYSQESRHGDIIGSGEGALNYFPVEEPIDDPESSPDTTSANEHDFSCSSCFSDMELVFEFFENEQPQQRKPLYDKVRDIIKLGTSSHTVFGDPSRLDCMNLDNIHPASWYSVAWYPIYRIPEGNFRASFLTYHSLGHFVKRCIEKSQKANQYSVVYPVVGLQSYNAQGECWLSPRVCVEPSKGFSLFNCSEILRERLRTLEEAAAIFARGCVHKDNVKVTNRQGDYEFFLSRKR